MPVLDPGALGYTGLLATAASKTYQGTVAVTGGTTINLTNTSTYPNNTWYVNGNVTINSSFYSPVNINGPGNIVVNGRLSITGGGSANFNNSCKIISSGAMTLSGASISGPNSVFYSGTSIECSENGGIIDGALLSNGRINMGFDNIDGLVFSGNSVTSYGTSAYVNGCVIAQSINFSHSSAYQGIVYNSDYFPASLPSFLAPASRCFVVAKGSWKEY